MDDFSFAGAIAKVCGFLGILVVLCLYLVKYRGGNLRRRPGNGLTIVDSLPLGQKRSLCVVKWNGSLFLLGITDTSITLVKETDEPGPLVACENPEVLLNEPSGKSFMDALRCEIKKVSKRLPARRLSILLLIMMATVFSSATAVSASPALPVPQINISVGGEAQGGLGMSLGILGMLTVLTLAPAILILTTCFTRMVVVFSFLRSGLGTQQTPPNQIMIGIALLMTFFVMAPTWSVVNEAAIAPYIAGELELSGAIERASGPLKEFMLKETRETDLALFAAMGTEAPVHSPEDMSLLQVVPAFAISELRTAFEMGFMLYLPFLVVDMVVSSTLMAMGMLMLPPVLISLPFKILLFILVDGWALITKSLVAGFN